MAILNKTTLAQTVSTAIASTSNLQSTTGDDVILVGNPTFVGTATAMDGAGGVDEIRFTSATAAQTLTLANANVTNIELVTITANLTGVAGAVPTGTTALNIDASLVTAHGLTITGNDGANVIKGTAATDTIVANGGADIINGTVGDDDVDAGAGDDIIVVGAEADHQNGVIDGGLGSDEVRFQGTSNETLFLNAGDVNIEKVTIGTGTTAAAASVAGTIALNVDASLYGSLDEHGLTITGNAGANVISGTEYNDTIVAGGGVDTLYGNGGDDVLVFSGAVAALTPADVDGSFIDGGDGNDIFVFTEKDLSPTEGPSLAVDGNTGFDEIRLANVSPTTGAALAHNFEISDAFGGPDGVDNIEAVTLGTGTGATAVTAGLTADNLDASFYVQNGLVITGNAGANTISGTGLDDIIIGGVGADKLNGGMGGVAGLTTDGNDTFVIKAAADFAAGEKIDGGDGDNDIRFASTTAGETLTLSDSTGTHASTFATPGVSSIQNITSVTIGTGIGATADITGTTALNINASTYEAQGLTITGNDGNNIITGTILEDTIYGGGGNDTINAGGAGSGDTVDAGTGNDTIIMKGGSVDGLLDSSVFDGGDGNDLFVLTQTDTNANDGPSITTLEGGAGFDEVRLVDFVGTVQTQHNFVIADADGVSNIEAVTLGTGVGATASNGTTVTADGIDASGYSQNGLVLTGNTAANIIIGSTMDDVINGGGGNDNLQGYLGNDAFIVTAQADLAKDKTYSGGDGHDEIRYVSTSASTLTLSSVTASNSTYIGIEAVTIGSGTGAIADTTGTAAINIDASLFTANGLVITGNDGANIITGTQFDDILVGGAGNDVFIIKNSADHGLEVISGGAGADEIRFTSAVADDTLFLSPFIDVETVRISDALGAGTGTVALNIDASAVSASDLLDAGGSLALIGNAGDNSITGSELVASNMSGGAGNDTLVGGSQNDTLNGGAGNDLVMGGEGDDTYVISTLTDYTAGDVIDDIGDGNDTISNRAAGTLVLTNNITGIERIDLGATAQVNGVNASAALNNDGLDIFGNAGANTIIGTNYFDLITGAAGADTLSGGGGDDAFIVNSGADGTGDVVNGGAGLDTLIFQNTVAGATNLTLTLGATTTALEQVVIGVLDLDDADVIDNTGTTNNNVNASALAATASIAMLGNYGDNALTGGAGNDVIEGSFGKDTLVGGAGNDTFIVREADEYNTLTGNDAIDGGLGIDTLLFATGNGSLDLVLASTMTNVEIVTLGDPSDVMDDGVDFNVDASAVATALTINGNAGDNTIVGTVKADTILAGVGNDTIIVNRASHHGAAETINGGDDIDTVQFTSTVKNDTLILNVNDKNIEIIDLTLKADGTANTAATRVNAAVYKGDLIIEGNDGNNALTGGSGNDTINGAGGNDTISGGTGIDTIDGGTGNDFLVGGTGNDVIDGGNGLDVLIGGQGNDVLSGGFDNDVFIYYSGAEFSAGDEFLDGGTGGESYDFDSATPKYFGDSIFFASRIGGDTLSLSADVTNIESVYIGSPSLVSPMINGALALNVDASDVTTALVMVGNNGANVITGTDDIGHNGPDGIDDFIQGRGGNDTIIAGDGDDVLDGGTGNDTLDGGAGYDTLTGGAGNDHFFFKDIADWDEITDFVHGQDTIDLELYFPSPYNAGDTLTAGDFIKGAGVTDGKMIAVDTATGNIYYDLDGSGVGSSLLFAKVDVSVAVAMTNADFLYAG